MKFPDIANEWDYERNYPVKPDDTSSNDKNKVWWLCKLKHSFYTNPISRTRSKSGCPYCKMKKVLIGFNDLWTTHPHVAKLLLNPKDGYENHKSSDKKVDWKCDTCGTVKHESSICNVVKKGLSCAVCSDGFSFPERVMASVFLQIGAKFLPQKSFEWSKKKRYDFFIPHINCIVETHGRQHYVQNTGAFGRVYDVKEEQANDTLKERLAFENGIEKYIIIDCKSTTLNYIKKSILNSEISMLFDLSNIDWNKVLMDSTSSQMKNICELYNDKHCSSKDISKETSISLATVIKYLKRGSELGICDYEVYGERSKQIIKEKNGTPVVQLALDGEYINSFVSCGEGSRSVGGSGATRISACCRGESKTAYKFKWMYKEDYDKMLEKSDL